jgi:hypothetical protein
MECLHLCTSQREWDVAETTLVQLPSPRSACWDQSGGLWEHVSAMRPEGTKGTPTLQHVDVVQLKPFQTVLETLENVLLRSREREIRIYLRSQLTLRLKPL